MNAREEVLAMTETAPTATLTAAGRVTWSFAVVPAASTQHPAPRTSSAAGMDVVPGPMIFVQRYEYTGRELASEASGRRASGPMPGRRSEVSAANVNYFCRYRVYGPALGQFFTRDPLGYEDGMGLYGGWFAQCQGRDPAGRLIIFNPDPDYVPRTEEGEPDLRPERPAPNDELKRTIRARTKSFGQWLADLKAGKAETKAFQELITCLDNDQNIQITVQFRDTKAVGRVYPGNYPTDPKSILVGIGWFAAQRDERTFAHEMVHVLGLIWDHRKEFECNCLSEPAFKELYNKYQNLVSERQGKKEVGHVWDFDATGTPDLTAAGRTQTIGNVIADQLLLRPEEIGRATK